MRLEMIGDVAVLRLEGGKANAMDDAFLDGLERVLNEFEVSRARAAVVTGYGTSFSAGLNLSALAPLSRGQLRAFLGRFHRVMLRVFVCARPVVAAVNGHAIAGGCTPTRSRGSRRNTADVLRTSHTRIACLLSKSGASPLFA